MKGGFGNILKHAQAMQENLRKAQEELANIEVTGSSGGGLVSITMTCRHDVRRVQVDPALLQEDKEVVEDLIAAAVNDAARKADKAAQERMAGLTSGLNIPGLNLPF
ncbi:MAG: nucleoid-associated protein, YbaB/EbfC family [Candidatus Muproteobacteria bacterium RIFCSPHIGHO2_01_FULL_65_16]|uniref:Nucleoid-associated protein A2V92_02680 n=2 Tax=Candidatus Muproteobacteria TaxID=1817795 RepID=A0A1F6TJC6_9PROT|nr:MAG: nucleoid-associated protein, YbaB/EbfC family [Candidatus Muproteobacteria bacterium RIFCSPHIGHO2_01_FULL_65_16]OGI45211.1 MAG: nucleoid-associated protein, YbaB/EbfC family [Candidatus Muproteobacteria bacterium RBG_16_65_31]